MAQINIMAARHSAFYTPLIYTMAGGFLKEEGLEPNYSVADTPQDVIDGIAGGTVDCTQLAVSRSWGFMNKGEKPPIAHFAQINERDGFFIAGRAPDPDFSWAKLAGKSVIADHGGQPLAMFKYACKKVGLDFAGIDAIDAGNTDQMEAAFRGGAGDYVHLQGPAPQQLQKDGVGHVVASVGEAIGPVAFSTMASSWEWLETDMAKAFMRAYRKARQQVNDLPARRIAETEKSFFDSIDIDVLSETIAFYQKLGSWNPDPTITRAQYEVALDVFENAGLVTARHAYEDVVAPPPDEG